MTVMKEAGAFHSLVGNYAALWLLSVKIVRSRERYGWFYSFNNIYTILDVAIDTNGNDEVTGKVGADLLEQAF